MTRATGLRTAAAVCAVMSLGGCLALGDGAETVRAISVTSRDVTIMGPAGFCVDREASRSRGDSAFVVLGSCAAIADRPTLPQPDVPVVLTAAVARGRAVTPPALEAYFRSRMAADKARQAVEAKAPGKIAARQPARDVIHVLDVAEKNDVVYIHYRDRQHTGAWRGILEIDPDVTITLALRTPAGVKVRSKEQLSTLRDFAEQILRANGSRNLGSLS